MKTTFLFLISVLLSITIPVTALAEDECATIQDGSLENANGETLYTGYDDWGYNYQARLFNGGYCDSYRGASWCLQWADVDLTMKWNDAWLSNQDCDGDNLLDRHYGDPSYIGSGAWITNHQSGWVEVNGKDRRWTYFVKIVAVMETDILHDGVWYTEDGEELGPVIWTYFAIVEEVVNDPSAGLHGRQYGSPVGPGLGRGHLN